jgi:adenylate kinase family enzyme
MSNQAKSKAADPNKPHQTQAQCYKQAWDNKFTKYKDADKKYILDNLLNKDSYVNSFIKQVIEDGQILFDNQPKKE